MKMYKKCITILIALIFTLSSCSKTEEKANIKDSVNTSLEKQPVEELPKNSDIRKKNDDLNKFIPENYSILDTVSGDLNLDGTNDLLLVLKRNGEDTLSDPVSKPEKRPLIILLRNTEGGFTLAKRNDNTVFCVNCGGMMGDPYSGIKIKDGYFTIEHYGGSATKWIRFITYKYSKENDNWYLHKDVTESYHTSDPEKKQSFIKSSKELGKIPFEDYNIYKDE